METSLPLPASIDGVEVLDDMKVVATKYLFGKVLMPSDVFWVTEQLVIPDEHAGKLDIVTKVKDREGFFVIMAMDGMVPGKLWRFRYWNHNSIHRLTSGWGCYVKEKGLTAGDAISFFHGTTCGRLFISCNCKRDTRTGSSSATMSHPRNEGSMPVRSRNVTSKFGGAGAQHSRRSPRHRRRSLVHPEQEPTDMPPILESMTLVPTPPPTVKRVRLFGVYIDAPPPLSFDDEPNQESNSHCGRAIDRDTDLKKRRQARGD
ncbi:putative B3 domain-containing protein Os02g0455900 [Oryza brachyantha]|uniref:TF-B3 domain-containing protein n=1 Tax=Oryza brachyantha TaxID=4533 RepID=J3LCJ3_ORYBR|nr:putative B3 domain-containing protein Os02g0455900 [Oryza brachyantha]